VQIKHWYYLAGPMIYQGGGRDGFIESHGICVQSPEDMQLCRRSTTGAHFVAIVFSGPAERAAFEKRTDVFGLGHLHENRKLPAEVAAGLAAYGVDSTHGLRDALKLVIAASGVHTLALGEL